MPAIFILICRYVFVALAAVFLGCGAAIIFTGRAQKYVSFQTAAVFAFHALAFAILALNAGYGAGRNGTPADMAAVGAGFLIILFAVNKLFGGPFINCVLFLLDIGFVTIARLDVSLAARQLGSACVGLACMVLLPKFFDSLKKIKRFEMILLITGAFLAALPFFFGSETFGAANWITAGPLSFQPSEGVKILFVIYLASAFNNGGKARNLIIPAAFGAFIALTLAAQRDLGGALVFFAIFLCMLYLSNGNLFMTAGVIFIAAGACAAAYFFSPGFFSHAAVRFAAWRDPWPDIDAGGYQIAQALFAIGTWGVFGSGLTRGFPGRIPVAERDFIFPAVCEEFGVIFGACVLLAAAALIYFGFREAEGKKDGHESFLAAGFVFAIAFQGFLSVGGNIKLIPHTGVTLPFMSYGGSSLAVCLAMAAFIMKRREKT